MTRRTRVLAIVMVGAAVPACSVLAGLTENYRVADGSSPTGEGGNGDEDGALPDGFIPDGGADALPDQVEADGGNFCDRVNQLNADFCDDFEDAPLTTDSGVPPNWSRLQNDNGAMVRVVAGGKDGARGLDVDGTIGNTMLSRNVFLVKTLARAEAPEVYLTYDVDFDFKVLESGADYLRWASSTSRAFRRKTMGRPCTRRTTWSDDSTQRGPLFPLRLARGTTRISHSATRPPGRRSIASSRSMERAARRSST